MMKALFIIDFDFTIAQEHVHNLLSSAIASGLLKANDSDAQWNYVKSIPPTGTKEAWRNLFAKLEREGCDVAIASFCDYKTVVERYLREKIGLPEAIMKKIYIESWLPANPNSADKTKHIENVIKHFNYTGTPDSIVLIDDSKINLNAARAKHYRVVEVTPGDKAGQHIAIAMELLEQMENQ